MALVVRWSARLRRKAGMVGWERWDEGEQTMDTETHGRRVGSDRLRFSPVTVTDSQCGPVGPSIMKVGGRRHSKVSPVTEQAALQSLNNGNVL